MSAVKMSPLAAAALAEACRWASYRAEDIMDDERKTEAARVIAAEHREWLDWGSRWLASDNARVALEDSEAAA